jgi:O-antigen/teichoic acid export membrane protein
MSLAGAGAVSALVEMALYLYAWRDWSNFRLVLSEWRSVIGFGVHASATGILGQIGEATPYFIIGRTLDAVAVGVCQRAVLLASFPERVILAGVGAVALPAFSQEVRDGQSPRSSYLKALGLITAVLWPALIMLMFLAHPIVQIVLGTRWAGVAPVLQILAGAFLFSFPLPLHFPTLVAVGAIRIVPFTVLAQAVMTISVTALTAPSGIEAVALGALVYIPFCSVLSLAVLRHFLKFGWIELAAGTFKSAIATSICAVGPAAIMIATGWQEALSLSLTIVASALALAGWLVGLWLSTHPLLNEMGRIVAKLRSRIGAKMAGAGGLF